MEGRFGASSCCQSVGENPFTMHILLKAGMSVCGVERAGCAVSEGKGASDPRAGVPQPPPSLGAFHVCAQLRLGLS